VAQNKTTQTKARVSDFIKGVADPVKREDCRALLKMMREATGKRAQMWGKAIVGFGRYEYTYESGRSGEMFLVGLSPRAQNIAVYIMPGFTAYTALLKKLGRHSTGKSCLYIKRLSDVDSDVLATLIQRSVVDMKKKYQVD
jgi:hypothetical protein